MNLPGIILVTGTDTGVGKTITTAALAAVLHGPGRRVAVYKPCQSGAAAGDSDTAEIIRLAGAVTAETGVVLQEPLAPVAAAAVDGTTLPTAGGARRTGPRARRHPTTMSWWRAQAASWWSWIPTAAPWQISESLLAARVCARRPAGPRHPEPHGPDPRGPGRAGPAGPWRGARKLARATPVRAPQQPAGARLAAGAAFSACSPSRPRNCPRQVSVPERLPG